MNYTVYISRPTIDANGIYLVKRVSTIPLLGFLFDHYGVAVGVNLLRAFGLSGSNPLIIQKNEWGVTDNEIYKPWEWQIVRKAEPYEIPGIIARGNYARASMTNFDLPSHNCEQFSRFIFDGIEQSYQVQGWGTLAVIGTLAYLGSRDN